jgi:hypothetical protein
VKATSRAVEALPVDGPFAETAIVDYRLSFADQGKQTTVFRFHLQQINGSLLFLFSVCKKASKIFLGIPGRHQEIPLNPKFSLIFPITLYLLFVFHCCGWVGSPKWLSVRLGGQSGNGATDFFRFWRIFRELEGDFPTCLARLPLPRRDFQSFKRVRISRKSLPKGEASPRTEVVGRSPSPPKARDPTLSYGNPGFKNFWGEFRAGPRKSR